MLDYRFKSFLTLYECMNYHRAAEALNLSQPAVTQHIQALEREYGCRFFTYDGKKLARTENAERMASYIRASLYNDVQLRRGLAALRPEPLRIGATKTIGEYVIGEQIVSYLADASSNVELTVDNTERLLGMLDGNQLDFAMVEGLFDKGRYGYRRMRREPFVGICASSHPFAGKTVSTKDMLGETLILREKGSGTRAILEQVLRSNGYAPDSFKRVVCISSFTLICEVVNAGEGISFVYQAIAAAQAARGMSISTFCIKETDIVREFNYVYLPGTEAATKLQGFLSRAAR